MQTISVFWRHWKAARISLVIFQSSLKTESECDRCPRCPRRGAQEPESARNECHSGHPGFHAPTPSLQRQIDDLVPKIVSEEAFWRNYFYRVTLLRESMEGESYQIFLFAVFF